jgi:hypothetical protein
MEACRINLNEAYRRTLLIAGAAGLNNDVLAVEDAAGLVAETEAVDVLSAVQQQDKWANTQTSGNSHNVI